MLLCKQRNQDDITWCKKNRIDNYLITIIMGKCTFALCLGLVGLDHLQLQQEQNKKTSQKSFSVESLVAVHKLNTEPQST